MQQELTLPRSIPEPAAETLGEGETFRGRGISPREVREELCRELVRSLKKVSGHLALKRFDRIPEEIERVESAFENYALARGSRDEQVFAFLDSVISTENWHELPELKMGKIYAITKMLSELE